WDGRRGERREAGRDAGDDAERNAGGRERLRLLAAASEYERIATLEPQHPLAGARQLHQAPADVALRRRWFAATLAGEFEPRLRIGERQYARIDKRIVHDYVGLLKAGERVERQQTWIAGPRAREPDVTWSQERDAAASRRHCIPGCHGGALPW